jgi:hypothetical protein
MTLAYAHEASSSANNKELTMRKLSNKELKEVRGGSQPPGQLGYEGQPGNQGGGGGSKGQKGYEGQPGNQSHHK